MVFAAAPGQVKSQVESPLQLSEQGLSEQVTLQFEPLVHETLPLLPTVTVQLDLSQSMLPLTPVVRVQVLLPWQLALHEPKHVPEQVLAERHESDWLAAAAAPASAPPPHEQAPPAWQVQAVPEQAHPGPGQADGGVPPHAEARATARTANEAKSRRRMGLLLRGATGQTRP
jgi:hypothetical protein